MAVRRRNNKWMIDIRFTHPDGREKRIRKISPVNTKRGAEAFERQTREALLDGTYNKRKEESTEENIPRTFAEFAEVFMQKHVRANNKVSEAISKESILRNHLLPAFGTKKLDTIGTEAIDSFKVKKMNQGKAPKTIYNHLAVLHKMFTVAHDYGYLQRVPKFNWPKFPEPEFDFLDTDEAALLVAHAEPFWQSPIGFVLNTGLRLGEMLELRGKDLNLAAGIVKVNRTIYRKHIGTPKSGRGREIPLNQAAVSCLPKRLIKPHELVFKNREGNHWSEQQAKSQVWKAARNAGIRRIGWHVLRHTFASHLVIQGVPLKVVQELLGHASITMTERYSHLTPGAKKAAVEVLDRKILGTIWAQKNDEFRNSSFLQ